MNSLKVKDKMPSKFTLEPYSVREKINYQNTVDNLNKNYESIDTKRSSSLYSKMHFTYPGNYETSESTACGETQGVFYAELLEYKRKNEELEDKLKRLQKKNDDIIKEYEFKLQKEIKEREFIIEDLQNQNKTLSKCYDDLSNKLDYYVNEANNSKYLINEENLKLYKENNKLKNQIENLEKSYKTKIDFLKRNTDEEKKNTIELWEKKCKELQDQYDNSKKEYQRIIQEKERECQKSIDDYQNEKEKFKNNLKNKQEEFKKKCIELEKQYDNQKGKLEEKNKDLENKLSKQYQISNDLQKEFEEKEKKLAKRNRLTNNTFGQALVKKFIK